MISELKDDELYFDQITFPSFKSIVHENLPDGLKNVLNKDENFIVLKNDIEDVKKFVKSKI